MFNFDVAQTVEMHTSDTQEMVHVPAGEFQCGEALTRVRLPVFRIDRTPVTNSDYARFVAATGHPSPPHWGSSVPSPLIADHPVVNVSWQDAMAYAAWAGKRLPTETEWEKAARGTDKRMYPWGNWEEGRCNTFDSGILRSTPVDHFSPQGDSPYGCADMSGNVWEWTASWYDETHRERAVRGGCWIADPSRARVVSRRGNAPETCSEFIGFRLVTDGAE